MTKGERIEYAIRKEVTRYSFVEWREEWDISEEDWDKFMDAGRKALTEEESEE